MTRNYKESDSHRPKATDMYGTPDTTGTGGAKAASVESVSPIFAEARARELETAAKALDPNDPTPAALVTLPADEKERDKAEARVKKAARESKPDVKSPKSESKAEARPENK